MQNRVVLATDTSSSTACFAIARNQEILGSLISDPLLPHSQTLFPTIKKLLQNTGLVVNDINVFAVVTGPGSLTGVRVGLTAMKAFAQATGSNLFKIDVLGLIALNVKRQGKYLVLLELSNNEVFAGVREINEVDEVQQAQSDVVGSIEFVVSEFELSIHSGATIIRAYWPESPSAQAVKKESVTIRDTSPLLTFSMGSLIQPLTSAFLVNTLALYTSRPLNVCKTHG
jgi:tRNA threonylcarbamoyl adenosine modification protein YeaZ